MNRPRPTVRLELEGLTERILLSATPVAPLPASPLAAAVMDRVDQIFVAVQNEASNIVRTLAQGIAQEAAYFQVQLDHLLGINPNPQNPSLNSPMQPVGNGSGGVSGATTTPPSADSQLSPDTSNDPSPDGPDHLGVTGYLWDPTIKTNGEYLASTGMNWDYNMAKQNPATAKKPGDTPGDPVTFDPELTQNPGLSGNGDAQIIWDYNATFPGMSLGVQSSYSAMQTINSKIKVEMTGLSGSSLTALPTSALNLQFLGNTSKFQIDANATITNMDLNGGEGLLEIEGGVTNIAQLPSYDYDIGAPVDVAQDATLNDQSYAALNFRGAGMTLSIEGTMQTFYGAGTGTTLMTTSNNNNGDYINVNGGTLKYAGKAGVVDTFVVPVFVQNGGNFSLTTALNQPAGGKLIVQDGTGVTFPNGMIASVDMTGGTSKVLLSQKFILEVDDGYYQDSGLLETTDNTECQLTDGTGQGQAATITGGILLIDNQPETYGQLDVIGGLSLSGELAVSIQGYTQQNPKVQGTSDLLQVSGTLGLNENTSSLYVYNYGAQQGDSWNVITSNNIAGDFCNETSNPEANLTYGPPNVPNKGQYRIEY